MELELNITKHHNSASESDYENLIGIDDQKSKLLCNLCLAFDKEALNKWQAKHHAAGLPFFNAIANSTPLVILAGDVGCGKTALANSIGSPLSRQLGKRVVTFETPSDIRGSGRVGEISNRITAAFGFAKSKLHGDDLGILIIDEADDLATDREQNQAHHEDRAGLNVLIKQIDQVAREKANLAVILITNRLKVLDPAVVRRAAQVIKFERPGKTARKQLFDRLFNGTLSAKHLNELVSATERSDLLYSYSDLVQKIGKQAMIKAIREDRQFDKEIYLEVQQDVEPSPTV